MPARLHKKRLVIYLVFAALFVFALSRLREELPPFVIALSPAVQLGNLLTIIQGHVAWMFVAPALILLVANALSPRVFCWYVCPLGCLQDALPTANLAIARARRYNLFVGAFLFAASLSGINFMGFFDPLVLFAHVVNVIMRPTVAVAAWAATGTCAFVLVLSMLSWRFWCWHVCPLGAVFDTEERLKQWFRQKRPHPRKKVPVDGLRRSLIAAGVGGVAAGLAMRFTGGAQAESGLIRPPGVHDEEAFKAACIRCGNCITACITKGLRPAITEGGLDGFLTPHLVPRVGECDEYCTRCGAACPVGAIPALPLAAKRNECMGVAVVDQTMCLGWGQNALCFICGEFCPYLALERHMKDGAVPCPIVRPNECRGCGMCEKQCPTHAIRVVRTLSSK